MSEPRVSVVVPIFNEEQSVPPLIDAVRQALVDEDQGWELLLVDDGSTDRSAEIARAHSKADPRVRLLRLARNFGQTAAMQAGFDHARGRVVVSMDGDLQNDPRDIPRLLEKLEEGYDLVAGYRERRQDHLIRRKIPSWMANRIIRGLTGVNIRDNGCSLKAYRSELLKRLHLYSDMHRFIPALAASTAGARIAEIPVRHHPRRFGESKYGLTRVAKVLADLLVIKMIRSFRERPLVLFSIGALSAFLMTLVFAGLWITLLLLRPETPALPLAGVSILLAGLAVYLMMLGLIGEVALRKHLARGAGTPSVPWQASR